ncbi:hypothetical protein BJY17_003509 [Agromyces hippuratus]|uniref:Uncharacterized protein n=1 Tax=Agromyces hippuratus TaxID=286438 RepID=A0A852WWP8_9MICO|nr:hypothetical protein [Agromyces hippuratus]NYG22762.1 hypothetical protein [Agromyces hippuratus]
MSGRLARAGLAVAVRLLPDARRERYREEWAADLRDAPAAGVSTAQLVAGAFGVVLRAPRSPEAFGLTSSALAGRRLRWAAAWFAAAVSLALGSFFLTPFTAGGAFGEVGSRVMVVVALVGGVGLVWLAAAVHGLLASRGAGLRWAVSLGVVLLTVPVVAMLTVALVPAMMLGGMLAGAATVVFAWALPAATDPERRRTWPGLPARLGTRATALVGAIVVLGGAAVGAVHILVWNPLSKVPGLALPEIYAQMADRGEPAGPAAAYALVWAATWAPLGLLFLATAVVGNRGTLRRLDARRIARASLVAVFGIGFTQWVGGFSMGMSIADAFAVSGGDSAVSGLLLTAAATVAGVIVALRVLPPASVARSPRAAA